VCVCMFMCVCVSVCVCVCVRECLASPLTNVPPTISDTLSPSCSKVPSSCSKVVVVVVVVVVAVVVVVVVVGFRKVLARHRSA
jgi:hypothetical protein